MPGKWDWRTACSYREIHNAPQQGGEDGVFIVRSENDMLARRRRRRCLQAPPWLDPGFVLRDRVARQHRPTIRRVGTLVYERRVCRFHRCCRVPVGLLTVLAVRHYVKEKDI